MNIYEKTERYIEGLLDDREKALFEAKLKNDPKLEKIVAERIKLQTIIEQKLQYNTAAFTAKELEDLGITRDQEKEIDEDLYEYYFKKKKENDLPEQLDEPLSIYRRRSGFPGMILLRYAAGIALMFIVSISIWKYVEFREQKQIAREVFTNYFKPDEDPYLNSLSDPPSGEITMASLLFKTINEMREGNYKEAYKQFMLNEFRTEQKLIECSQFYNALNLLSMGRFKESREQLRILCSGYSVYSEKGCTILRELGDK